MAEALATEALAPLTTNGLALLRAALVLLRRPIVLLRALALGPQPTGPTEAHPTLEGPVAVVAAVAERLSIGLASAVAVESDLDGEAVLEAHRLDGEGLLLLLGAAAHLGLNAEAHLGVKQNGKQAQSISNQRKRSYSLPDQGKPRGGI